MKAEALEEVMMRALLMERKEFVELLLLNGFSMIDFLTVRTLRDLYNQGLVLWPQLMDQVTSCPPLSPRLPSGQKVCWPSLEPPPAGYPQVPQVCPQDPQAGPVRARCAALQEKSPGAGSELCQNI